MKTFMEEYGVIVVAATPLGNSIKAGIIEAVGKLTTALGTTASVVG